MNVDRLKAVHQRLVELTTNGGSAEAIAARLLELEAAIAEFEKRPQTHVNTDILTVPPHWKRWPDTLGWATAPYVRVDMLTLGQMEAGGPWYGMTPSHQFVLNVRGRKKHWKYPLSALAYLDRDVPCQDRRTWMELEAAYARSE